MSNVIELRPTKDPILRARGVEMNLRTRQVRHLDRPVNLTPTEFRLLYALMLNPNRVSPNATLRRAVNGSGRTGDNKVRFYIRSLRRKLDDHHRTLIRTAHGLGYLIAGRTPSPR